MSNARQMSIFLATYILVYGLMNAYALWRARAAFGLGTRGTLWLVGLGLFMVAGPILVRTLERMGAEGSARALAYVSYSWFGMVFLFLSIGMAFELLRLAIILSGKGAGWSWYPGRQAMFLLPLALSVAVFGYGCIEASRIRVEKVSMTSPRMNPMRRKVRIAQVSDIHVGLITGERRVRRMVEILRREKPDIIVCTGDLVDGTTSDSDSLAGIFSSLSPRYGMFAVMGNHEYYAGEEKSLALIRKAGFRLLRGEAVAIPTLPLSIGGVDFPSRLVGGQADGPPEQDLFKGLEEDNFRLLLKHAPLPDIRGGSPHFDLQLSGHTHKGQIFPFALAVRAVFRYTGGLYFLPEGSWLYVSRGTGVWGPPIRVLAPPEITIIEISPGI